MTDEALRNLLGAMSFLLAALSFLANERREAIRSLHERSDVHTWEKNVTLVSVAVLCIAAFGLALAAAPAVLATNLGFGDLIHLDSTIREAFVLGWVLLLAITLALGALVVRAWNVETSENDG